MWGAGGLLVVVVVGIIVAVNALDSDMFSGRDWMLQGRQTIEGRHCVRVYPGAGHGGTFLAVCRENEGQFSCWRALESGPKLGQVRKWGQIDRGDGDCEGAVREVEYQTGPSYDPFSAP